MPHDTTPLLDPEHWSARDFKQRMTTKQWSEILLEGRDNIIYRGTPCCLYAKNLGYGIVEVQKDFE